MRSHLRVGTIGCVLAAHLALAGNEVVGIARGAMLDPVRAAGELEIVTPREPDAPRSAAGAAV